MIKSSFVLSLALGGALMVGCDQKKDDTSTTPPPAPAMPSAPAMPAPPATMPATPTLPSTQPAADAIGGAAEKAKDSISGAVGAVTGGTGSTGAPPASPDDTAKAQSLLSEAEQYIKDNKLDDAAADLKKLDGMKASLPKDMQDKIGALQSALDVKKAAGGLKAPSVPDLSK